MIGYEVAKKWKGRHEVKDKAVIGAFIGLDPSKTPWCAAFVNACEKAVGKKGTGKLNARSFLQYGEPVDKTAVRPGDIVVFSRGGSSWQGHVAYFDGWEEDRDVGSLMLVRTLGGNQSDSVSIGWYPVSRVLGFRRS